MPPPLFRLKGPSLAAAALLLTGLPAAFAGDRLVRVVSVSQEGLPPGADLVKGTLARLNEAAEYQPDIACLPEEFTRNGPETVPGPTSRLMAGWARSHHCYVICPMQTLSDGRIRQSALLLDREGRVVGRYDKAHPTEKALAAGTIPGDSDPPVFQTDFGTIGIQICFDLNWREGWRRLKEKGAQIVFWPSAYAGKHQMPVLAFLDQCYVVTATMRDPPRIYDITGDEISAGRAGHWWAAATLNLGKRLFEVDYNAPKMAEIERRYSGRVRVTWYHEDDWITLESVDPSVTVKDLVQQFGLTPLTDYIARAGLAQDQRR